MKIRPNQLRIANQRRKENSTEDRLCGESSKSLCGYRMMLDIGTTADLTALSSKLHNKKPVNLTIKLAEQTSIKATAK